MLLEVLETSYPASGSQFGVISRFGSRNRRNGGEGREKDIPVVCIILETSYSKSRTSRYFAVLEVTREKRLMKRGKYIFYKQRTFKHQTASRGPIRILRFWRGRLSEEKSREKDYEDVDNLFPEHHRSDCGVFAFLYL
jgi:hypothetical protein